MIVDGKDVPTVDVTASAAAMSQVPTSREARKQARAVKPGSFMHLLMSARHTADNSPFTDIEIIAQAFVFLLAGRVCAMCLTIFSIQCGSRCCQSSFSHLL